MKRAPRTAPFTPAELRTMFADGDSIAQVHARAYRLDRSMSKDRVRAILFQHTDVRDIGRPDAL